MLNFVHVPVNYILILNALPQVEWMIQECLQCNVQAPYCVGCPKAEDTIPYSVFEVRHLAVSIQNQKKVFHKAKVKVILYAQLLQGAWL